MVKSEMRRQTLGLDCNLIWLFHTVNVWVMLLATTVAEPIRAPAGFPTTQDAGPHPPTPQEALQWTDLGPRRLALWRPRDSGHVDDQGQLQTVEVLQGIHDGL